MLIATRPPLPLAPAPGNAVPSKRRRRQGARGVLWVALALSLLAHLAFVQWPLRLPEMPEDVGLQATLTQLPPPPQSAAPVVRAPKARPKSRPVKRAAPIEAPSVAAAPAPEAVAPPATPDPVPAPEPVPAIPPPPQYVISAPEPLAVADPPLPAPAAEAPRHSLPPRVDLAYRVFLGTQGFYIGDATYRFEHAGNRYRIGSVGQAKGLAALILRGQGKVESRGLITPAGLQPDEFALERGNGRPRESARFDWESGVIALDGDKTEGLDLPTYDPLAFLWQFYFLPPTTDEQTFAIATTRRVTHYTFKREGRESIELPSGVVETERWHRRSEDGKTDAFVWLAPSMHYVAVKLRLAQTERGTVEALLDGIRVDPASGQAQSLQ